ncbi:unnamed protein product [Nesidiocoris tenuis]|uniref:PHD-type domain-containing protein n=1 Tax=Nesidiocoris tenuis TaxID=355587 RepID=A0A6H5HP58_9HEMI|nr:unnamed protein product [Nesidiocoris tenuis]
MNCVKCQSNLLPEDALTCAGCKGAFHFGCAGQSEANFRKMSKVTRSSWKCMTCRSSPKDAAPDLPVQSGSQNDNFLQSILAKMNEQIALTIRQELNPFKEEINNKLSSLQLSVDSCNEQYASLNTEMASIREEVHALRSDGLRERVKALEDKLSVAAPAGLVDEEAIYAEIEERRRCAANVLFFNVPESSSTNPADAIAEDLARLNAFITSLTPANPPSVKRGYRLGKRSADHTRPLKAIFETQSEATRVMASVRSTKSPQFPIAGDRTVRQRDFLRRLRTELQARKDNGEANLTIKYISGVPKIVPLDSSKNANVPPPTAPS